MLHFVPAWYQEDQWSEKEQYWYSRRMHTEFDDTVKHIQLFHRNGTYPFQILLLSFAPNLRHFLHRQGVFHAPYWSCFDAIQEVKSKKVRMFSFHNLKWPEHIEFLYSPFAVVALLQGKKYAQLEFGEDGNLIQVDLYQNDIIQRRNIYDDRGFIAATVLYNNGVPMYQDYLNPAGIWKIRYFFMDGHVEVNPKADTFLLETAGKSESRVFGRQSYDSMEDVIFEVLSAYVGGLQKEDIFCVAMHERHLETVQRAIPDHKLILSFFEERYPVEKYGKIEPLLQRAGYIIMDSKEKVKLFHQSFGRDIENVTDITPFDSRVDFGISQQLNVQKVLVPVDDMEEARFEAMIKKLAGYLEKNENARIHLFTRIAETGRKRGILDQTRQILRKAGFPEEWAMENSVPGKTENRLEAAEKEKARFFAEKCVSELEVSKCMREQRLFVDMRNQSELYLQIAAISMGIPQIVYKETPFVETGENGMLLDNMEKLPEALEFYLDNLTNWNEAMVCSYEIGKQYTTQVLLDKWKEVISFVRDDSCITAGN